ncbi:hypothetical protein [Phormidesmis sp. 146-33]
MNWDLYLQQFQEFVFSKSEHPPYVLLSVGLLIGATSGLAFVATLRLEINAWYKNHSAQKLARWERLKLAIPFTGTIAGLWVFLGAGLQALGLSPLLAWLFALGLAGFVGQFTWSQLGRRIGKGAVQFYLDQAFKFDNG